MERMRTEAEVIKASKFVAVMTTLALSDPTIDERCSTEEMRFIRIAGARMSEALEWVLGEDNKFGAMVQKFSECDEPETETSYVRHRRRSKRPKHR